MTLSPAQHLLHVAREVAAGTSPPALLGPLIGDLAPAVSEGALQFEQGASDNPEVDAGVLRRVLEAFGRYQQELIVMQQAAQAGDLAAVSAAADAIDGAITTIRTEQEAHAQTQERDGPTAWPYVNRIVRHMNYYLRDGMETRHTVALLEDIGAFVEHLQADADSVELSGDREAARAAVRDIGRLCTEFLNVLPRLADMNADGRTQTLEPMREALIAACWRLTNALGRHIERELTFGATELPIVNILLLAADRLKRGEIESAAFEEVLARCWNGVEATLPARPDPLVVDSMDVVKREIERVQAAIGDPDALDQALGRLTEATHSLAMYISVSSMPEWEHDDSIFDFTDGEVAPPPRQPRVRVPKLLDSLMRVSRDFLVRGDPHLLDKGLEMLDSSVSRFGERAAALPSDDPGKHVLEESIDLLREASESLKVLRATRDARALDAAEWSMQQACEGLSTI